jgi:hypothetical protein
MIEFKFKLENKTIKATVPEGWHEVTVKHLINLDTMWTGEKTDMIGLLSAFTDQNYEDLEQAEGNNLWVPLFNVLKFVFNAPDWSKLKKQPIISLHDKKIKPRTKVELHTFGQKVQALNVIASEKPNIEKIPEILAIYLQPSYDGKFISDRVEQIKPYILDMKASEAMPYGFFFIQAVAETEKLWQNRIEAIPQDNESAAIYQQAGIAKLQGFGDLITIDNLAKQYNYTHEQAYALDWEFVATLSYMHRLQDSINMKAQKIREKQRKTK